VNDWRGLNRNLWRGATK